MAADREAEVLYEVVFDEEFAGGLTIRYSLMSVFHIGRPYVKCFKPPSTACFLLHRVCFFNVKYLSFCEWLLCGCDPVSG